MATWAEAPILVPLDGLDESLRAVPVAARVARRLGNDVELLSVVSKQDEVDARSEWLFEEGASRLDGVEFTAAVAVASDIAGEITTVAEPGDLVCMATAGSVRFHSGHWGSVAEDVARTLMRPMLMVGPKVEPAPGPRTERVIAPMDGSSHSESAAVPAAELAGALEVPLWLVEVVSPMAQAAEAASHSGAVSGAEEEYIGALQERLGRVADIEINHEVIQSENPDRAIADYIGDVGLAVMSTHGRSGLSRLFAGSITAGVVANAKRPVAVISPGASS